MQIMNRMMMKFSTSYVNSLLNRWPMNSNQKFSLHKIKISLELTNEALRYADLWGSRCINLRFLDLGNIWRLLYFRGKTPSIHCTGGCLGPMTGLGDIERRNLLTIPELELQSLCLSTCT
jgi:hypothetical protein